MVGLAAHLARHMRVAFKVQGNVVRTNGRLHVKSMHRGNKMFERRARRVGKRAVPSRGQKGAINPREGDGQEHS